MRYYILYIFCWLLITPLIAQKRVWTLDECIEYAKANNINIRKIDNELKQIKIKYSYSKLNFLPTLNAGVTQSFDYGKNISPDNNQYTDLNTSSSGISLSMSIPISEHFKNYEILKMNKLDLRATLLELEQAKKDLAMNVTSAFLQVLYQRDLNHIAQKQVRLSAELYEKTKEMKRLEVRSKVDVSDVKAQFAQDQYSLTLAKNGYWQALLALVQLLDLPSTSDFDIDTVNIISIRTNRIPTLDYIYSYAVEQWPGIKAEKYRLQQEKQKIYLYKKEFIPNLSLQLGLNTGYYNIAGIDTYSFSQQWKNNFNKNVTFSLTIPLFNHLEVIKNIKSSRIQIKNQELSLEDSQNSLFKEIQEVYFKVIASKEKIQSCAFLVEASQELYNQVYEKYSIGKATSYEYNEAKTKLLKSQIEKIQAQYENKLNEIILFHYLQ